MIYSHFSRAKVKFPHPNRTFDQIPYIFKALNSKIKFPTISRFCILGGSPDIFNVRYLHTPVRKNRNSHDMYMYML